MRWYGKKRWEALPLNGTEDRWYILNYGGYHVYQETNACLVESIVNSCSFSKPQWYVLIMIAILGMFYQETNTCLVESIVNSCSFSKPRWYVFIMITILGKKKWEALPLHGTEDRWYIHITVNYGSYPVADLGGVRVVQMYPPFGC